MKIALLFTLLIATAYLWGSVPWGLLIGKLLGRVDIREYGSGKTGMTNVTRTVGMRAGILALILDLAKGALPVLAIDAVTKALSVAPEPAAYAKMTGALAALAGHIWSVYIGFQGGRGTAPGWGALTALSPWSGLVATAAGLPAILLSRYVSLGSIAGAFSGGLASLLLSVTGAQPLAYGLFALIGVPIVIFRHRENIQRLLRGTERRLGQRGEPIRPTSAHEQRG
ncbi:MAG: glycerol-3-phosphate 1-O-acyltransferase PlsY [Chloroflexi bacterium]|nr:glycerol-3-phosphate 1-O-acyltransferase PlsY [Chloroflexota bacterium]